MPIAQMAEQNTASRGRGTGRSATRGRKRGRGSPNYGTGSSRKAVPAHGRQSGGAAQQAGDDLGTAEEDVGVITEDVVMTKENTGTPGKDLGQALGDLEAARLGEHLFGEDLGITPKQSGAGTEMLSADADHPGLSQGLMGTNGKHAGVSSPSSSGRGRGRSRGRGRRGSSQAVSGDSSRVTRASMGEQPGASLSGASVQVWS